MIRVGIGLVILAAVALPVVGYWLGARHGKALERRWSKIVGSAIRFRRLELQGSPTADDELQHLRMLLDSEVDLRDRAYLELEDPGGR